MTQPLILNVHTPSSSFSIIHSLNQESLTTLFDKLAKKADKEYRGQQRVGPGWLKYEYNGTIWDLDDDSDYTIFVWRQQQYQFGSPDLSTNDTGTVPSIATGEPGPSTLQSDSTTTTTSTAPPLPTARPAPTLHFHNPALALPPPGAYRNTSYYKFSPVPVPPKISPAPSSNGRSSQRSSRTRGKKEGDEDGRDGIPKLVKQFEKFHSENGVRTVIGSIGSVHGVRMLLKVGYRHVYMSRRFAQKHGFIPRDALPGNYGYGGLVNIGTWPISLVTSSTSSASQTDDFSSRSRSETDYNTNTDAKNNYNSGGEFLLKPPGKAGAIGFGIFGLKPGHQHGHGHGQDDRYNRRGARSPALSHHSNSASSTIVLSSSAGSRPGSPLPNGYTNGTTNGNGAGGGRLGTVTKMQVYLSEEPHFDVVLGRSFFEKRQIKTSSVDPTEVVCLDTGEKVECEVVILKDGKGEIVTVT